MWFSLDAYLDECVALTGTVLYRPGYKGCLLSQKCNSPEFSIFVFQKEIIPIPFKTDEEQWYKLYRKHTQKTLQVHYV